MPKSEQIPVYSWDFIESHILSLTPVSGGFSLAKRGVIRLPGQGTIFVKIGTEENSKRWAKKELAVYDYLSSELYSPIPEVLSKSDDQTSFALEPLLPEEGWDWSDAWTIERLNATLEAMDALAQLNPQEQSWATSTDEQALDASRNGWQILVDSPDRQKKLWTKLKKAGYSEFADGLDLKHELKRSLPFVFKTDKLVHYDVRADNCAWNPVKKEVKLVDWNWAQLGDTRIDVSATLVNVQRGGFDVVSTHADRLDADALQWLAGFWLRGAATPIWEGGAESLRNFQLEAGVTSLKLLSQLEQAVPSRL